HRMAQFRTRAFENMTAVALANYAAPEANGHSVAFDPIAFGDDGSRDTLVVEAGEGEGVFLATFDMTRVRDYRQRETMGAAFRRPALYGALTEAGVRPPFLRVDRSGAPFA
ncbi:MAG: carbon-nitrogen hydrolase family protein, partial [Thermomicrobiales bacterium]|nr:carbon-nitrogen hydrolase family protein [Thermomicrobiales bacterium]